MSGGCLPSPPFPYHVLWEEVIICRLYSGVHSREVVCFCFLKCCPYLYSALGISYVLFKATLFLFATRFPLQKEPWLLCINIIGQLAKCLGLWDEVPDIQSTATVSITVSLAGEHLLSVFWGGLMLSNGGLRSTQWWHQRLTSTHTHTPQTQSSHWTYANS